MRMRHACRAHVPGRFIDGIISSVRYRSSRFVHDNHTVQTTVSRPWTTSNLLPTDATRTINNNIEHVRALFTFRRFAFLSPFLLVLRWCLPLFGRLKLDRIRSITVPWGWPCSTGSSTSSDPWSSSCYASPSPGSASGAATDAPTEGWLAARPACRAPRSGRGGSRRS
jgi:hypothetical protein